jgi:hypothetical protein
MHSENAKKREELLAVWLELVPDEPHAVIATAHPMMVAAIHTRALGGWIAGTGVVGSKRGITSP